MRCLDGWTHTQRRVQFLFCVVQLAFRDQNVGIVNYFYQDFLVPGYTVQGSVQYLHDGGGGHTDNNGFVVRPAIVGTPQTHTIDSVYLGITSDGHIGPVNVNQAFYQVLGRDSRNPIAGKAQDLNAQMAATGGDAGVGTALYGSGTTFFTLGIGDVLPHTALGRLLVVLEAGLGFAFSR